MLAICHRTVEGIEIALGGVVKLGAVVARRAVLAKHLLKVLLPRVVHNGAVGDDDGAAHPVVALQRTHALGEFKGADGLSETHLGVPEEASMLLVPLEVFHRYAHSPLLLIAQLDAAFVEEPSAQLGLHRLNSSIYRHKPIYIMCYFFLLFNTNVEK